LDQDIDSIDWIQDQTKNNKQIELEHFVLPFLAFFCFEHVSAVSFFWNANVAKMSNTEEAKHIVHSADDVPVVPHRSRPFTTMVFGAVERLVFLGFRRQLNQVSQQKKKKKKKEEKKKHKKNRRGSNAYSIEYSLSFSFVYFPVVFNVIF
jgi:pyruvate/2-oxoglutarate dehydrogenase complex dihydrolipoamide acyltransferase (E2) component